VCEPATTQGGPLDFDMGLDARARLRGTPEQRRHDVTQYHDALDVVVLSGSHHLVEVADVPLNEGVSGGSDRVVNVLLRRTQRAPPHMEKEGS